MSRLSSIVFLWAGLALAWSACDSSSDPPVSYDPLQPAIVKDCDGNDVDLVAEVAKVDVTYITWGATWCTACREEVPVINSDIVGHFDASKVAALQILVEDDAGEPPPQELCANWRDNLNANYPILVDVNQVTKPQYFGDSVAQLPYHMIVTRDGLIRFKLLGPMPTDLQQRIQDWIP